MPVHVDPNFFRVYADQAVVMALGHDVDLAFVAVNPTIDVVHGHSDGSNEFKMTPSFAEVARVRMPPGAAAVTAVTIIERLIEHGAINKAELLKVIEAAEEPEVDEPEEGNEPKAEL